MVSKVAVIALVAIVACPILIGYGMNLQTATHTDYNDGKDPVNVTGLLLNGEYYNTAYADIYKLNSTFTYRYGAADRTVPVMPIYKTIGTTLSTMPQFQLSSSVAPNNYIYYTWDRFTSDFYWHVDESASVRFIDLESGVIEHTVVNGAIALYYKQSENTAYVLDQSYNVTTFTPYSETDMAYFKNTGNSTITMYYSGTFDNPNNQYVDISAGFMFDGDDDFVLDLPDYTKYYVATINLDTLSGYIKFKSDGIYTFTIQKTINDGVVSYYGEDAGHDRIDLYYDPNRSDNTYQLYFEMTNLGLDDNGFYNYNFHTVLKYVGSWPSFIGEAPYYMTYEWDDVRTTSSLVNGVRGVEFSTSSSTYSPIIRMDTAFFTGMLFRTIFDNTYDPAAFRSNPSTKITDISLFGSTLTFGGTTYDVKDGNITLGTKQFSIRNLVFESVPITGGYSNRINGIEISTSAAPSTIGFGGHWSAQVITHSLVEYTHTGTEWTPGQFGWDGIDQNFLMVGLLSAIGVFIALGVAFRKTKAALGGLLVVCGGAILLFFTML